MVKVTDYEFDWNSIISPIKWVIAIVAFIAIIISCAIIGGALVVVPVGYEGIWLEFGSLKQVEPPGLYFMIPFKDRMFMLPTQIMAYQSSMNQGNTSMSAASKDLQVVTFNVVLNYQLENSDEAMRFLWSNFQGEHERRIIDPIIHEDIKEVTAKYAAEELIAKRPIVASEIQRRVTEELAKYHINVIQFSIVNFDFSSDFNNAIEQKVVAEQNKLKEQQLLEQKQIQVQQQILDANASATAKVLRAQGDAQAVLINAEAQAKAIDMVREKLTPSYTEYLYVSKWSGELPTVLGQSSIIVPLNGSG